MKKKTVITEEDVQKALRKFVMEGGLIKHLPDQIVPPALMVGAKFGIYEPVMDTSVSSGE